jgi:hypothetical protein
MEVIKRRENWIEIHFDCLYTKNEKQHKTHAHTHNNNRSSCCAWRAYGTSQEPRRGDKDKAFDCVITAENTRKSNNAEENVKIVIMFVY